jgi:hypothetical protein
MIFFTSMYKVPPPSQSEPILHIFQDNMLKMNENIISLTLHPP